MILEKIYQYKQAELEHFKTKFRLAEIKARIRDLSAPQNFLKKLRETKQNFAVIAELKRQSPSKGILRENFEPVAIAHDYEDHGAAALSVLTDEHFFGGHLEHLRQVRQAVKLPLLRKDFIWDSYQVYAAREAGADAILLIVAMLEPSQVEDLQGLAYDLGMSVLVEVHDAEECKVAVQARASCIGINNRNLKNFNVDVQITEKLLPLLPKEVLKVSESGLDNAKILNHLKQQGVGAFLIGEAFLKEKSPGQALKTLLSS